MEPPGGTPLEPVSHTAAELEGELEPMTTTGPTMTLGEAARTTTVSASTLRRRLAAGDITGAERAADGSWSIPVAGLIEAGLMPRSTGPDVPAAELPSSSTTEPAEVARLSAEVARLRTELEAARTIAAERAEHITGLRKALDAMTLALPAVASSTTTPAAELPSTPPPSSELSSSSTTPARRRWWSRSK